MRVFKFGGASIKDAGAVRNVDRLLSGYRNQPLLVVASAMGKTTNTLEEICQLYFDGGDFSEPLNRLKSFHRNIIHELIPEGSHNYYEVENLFVELECILETSPEGKIYDRTYDQLVAFGELISTRILSEFLNLHDVPNRWLDARNFVVTSGHHRRARVDWETTESLIDRMVRRLLSRQIVLTQGFIGRSSENFTTTLGREGSDYTGAIFAYCLGADSLTIWKDVPGVLNADPKRVEHTVLLPRISFKEAIELAYYGASVIHPKTIQPLMRRNIPLYVRSFLNPEEDGTVVCDAAEGDLIGTPCYIFKDNQTLLSFATKDFSFIVEDHLRDLFDAFTRTGVQINLMQNTAISFSVCVNSDEQRIGNLLTLVADQFNVQRADAYQLLTVFNYNSEEDVDPLIRGRKIALEHKTGKTLQLLVESN